MTECGLSGQDIETFFEGNPELVETLTEAKVDAAVARAGYTKVQLLHGGNDLSPFKALVLQKQ